MDFQYECQSIVQDSRALGDHPGTPHHGTNGKHRPGKKEVFARTTQCGEEQAGKELLTCDFPRQHASLSLSVCDHRNGLRPGKQEASLLAPHGHLKSHLLGSCPKAFCITWKVRLDNIPGSFLLWDCDVGHFHPGALPSSPLEEYTHPWASSGSESSRHCLTD